MKSLIYIVIFALFSLNLNAQNIVKSKQIDALLKKKREYNRYNGTGFRIQLYNGAEKRAKNIKARFEREFYGIYTKLKYETPDWKVQVGSYKTRLDADRALNRIREKFSGAIVIPL